MSNQIVLQKVSGEATIFDVVAPAGVKNGNFVSLGNRNSNGTYACAAPAAITDKEIVMVLSVPLSYAADKAQNDYVIATGEVVRAYVPYKGMVVSIPVANITATVAVAKDAFVIPDAAALKAEAVAALGGTESVAFVVDEVYTEFGVSMAKLRCVVA